MTKQTLKRSPVKKEETPSSVSAPELSEQDRQKLLHLLMTVGENMIICGGEVYRVENTLTLMGKAYGASRMNVFVITSSMILTMTFPDGQVYTETRRLSDNTATDYTKLEAYNALSRATCAGPSSVEELSRHVSELETAKSPSRWEFLFGNMIAAGAFAVLFGGTVWDGLAASLFGLGIVFLKKYLPPLCSGKFIYNMIISLLTGLAVGLVCRLLPVLHEDKVLIGDIMLLIPGIAMTGAVRDVLAGDTISGLLRLVESVLWAAALAVGFIVAMLIV